MRIKFDYVDEAKIVAKLCASIATLPKVIRFTPLPSLTLTITVAIGEAHAIARML